MKKLILFLVLLVPSLEKEEAEETDLTSNNDWIKLALETAKALSPSTKGTHCVLCMLTPHSTKDGVPFVPLPLNISGIVTDWGLNHRTGQVKFNGTERVVVTPVPEKL